jgi:hypothetical protein
MITVYKDMNTLCIYTLKNIAFCITENLYN